MPEASNLVKKETPTQVFSCEFYENFKNTFFIGHLWWLLLAYENAPSLVFDGVNVLTSLQLALYQLVNTNSKLQISDGYSKYVPS